MERLVPFQMAFQRKERTEKETLVCLEPLGVPGMKWKCTPPMLSKCGDTCPGGNPWAATPAVPCPSRKQARDASVSYAQEKNKPNTVSVHADVKGGEKLR